MLTPIEKLFSTERHKKRIISISYDVLAIIFSLYISTVIRLTSWVFPISINEAIVVILTVTATIYCFIRIGMYRAVLRYMMIPALSNIFIGVIASAITLALSGFFLDAFIPRSLPFIYFAISAISLGLPRVLVRSFYYHHYKKRKTNVFIYGAGSTGRDLAYSLINGSQYNPVIILDDDPKKMGEVIFGIRVHCSQDFEQLNNLYQPKKLLLAINNISKGERLRLVEKISQWPIQIQSVPSVEDIATGKASQGEIRDLYIEDLLGRPAIEPNYDLLKKNIQGKNILITGAGGSIGSELCRQIIKQEPLNIILFELNEFNLYTIDQELNKIKEKLSLNIKITPILGSVQHKNRMKNVMLEHQIHTIYHAAAYKHVPIVEDNVIEGVRNNVFGTLATAEAAIETGVKNFTLISTDKAVRPTNIMGATKRLSELVLQALADKQEQTIFTIVRFGNVLDSSGSVVPLFKKQIQQGGPVTVTHPEIIRYFMMIPEAAQLVIQAGAMAKSGQVFVLDMGKPVKILYLAKRMIQLMGLTPYCQESTSLDFDKNGDIEVKFTGLRPGEKLYEELLIGNNVEGTEHSKIMTAAEEKLTWNEINKILEELDKSSHKSDKNKTISIIKKAPIEYHSENS